MKRFVVYDSNGSIISSGQCPDQDLQFQGENVLEVDDVYSFFSGWVSNGAFILYDEATQAKRMQVQMDKVWDNQQGDWV